MNNIRYTYGNEKLLDNIKEMWECLNEHHHAMSSHFKEFYENFKFDARKKSLVEKAKHSKIRLDFAVDEADERYVGYCVSSVDEQRNGEVESIYVHPNYRGMGIADKLMKSALEWMEEMAAEKIVVTVAAGNEQAFGFYEKFGFYPRRTVLEQIKK